MRPSDLADLHVGWCELWILADKFQMTDLGKAATRQLITCMDKTQQLLPATVEFVFNNTGNYSLCYFLKAVIPIYTDTIYTVGLSLEAVIPLSHIIILMSNG